MAQGGQTVYGSSIENGQLVPTLMAGQVFPSEAYVPYYAGRGAPTPTLPGVNLGNATGNVTAASSASDAGTDPWNAQKSPVIWAIGFIIVGIIGLRFIHFQGVGA
jgi:hypothetical protein